MDYESGHSNKYEVETGEGGMAVVYKVRHETLKPICFEDSKVSHPQIREDDKRRTSTKLSYVIPMSLRLMT